MNGIIDIMFGAWYLPLYEVNVLMVIFLIIELLLLCYMAYKILEIVKKIKRKIKINRYRNKKESDNE